MLFNKKPAKDQETLSDEYKLKTISPRNLVAADSIECQPSYVRINGDTYCASYFVHQLPPVLTMGWLDEIQTIGDIDIIKHIRPIPKDKAIKALVGRTSELMSQAADSAKSGDIMHFITGRDEVVSDYREFTMHVARNRDALFDVTVVITVNADSLEDLSYKCSLLEKKMAGSGSSFGYCRKALFRQDEALRTSFPLGTDFMKMERSFNVGALVCSYPARESDIIHKEGIFIGYNEITGSPVILDLFMFTNANLGIYGPPGSGKSYLVKLLTMRSAHREKVVLFDPGSMDGQGEYSNIVRLFGGKRIEVSPLSDDIINPLDINICESKEDDGTYTQKVDLAEKVDACKTLIRFMLEGKKTGELLSTEDLAVLEESLQGLYTEREISTEVASLYTDTRIVDGRTEHGRFFKEMPTLSDLLNKLRDRGMHKLVNVLRTYTREGTFQMFDGQTNVALDNNRTISFDLSKLQDGSETLKVAYYMSFNWVISNVVNTNAREKKKVVIDEAWMFMENEDCAAHVEYISRMARKRNASILVASQKVEDFLASKKGRAVLHNSAVKILLQQDRAEIESVIEQFKLNQGQANYLRGLQGKEDAGRGLLIAGNDIICLRGHAFDFEDELINTDPNRYV